MTDDPTSNDLIPFSEVEFTNVAQAGWTPVPLQTGGRISPRLFLHSFWSLGFVSIAALIFQIILTRILSIDAVGHIRVVRTVIEFCAIPAAFGMMQCIAKHIADSRTRIEERFGMFRTGAGIGVVAALIVSIVVFALLQFTELIRDEPARQTLHWMIFILPILALYSCLLGFLQGAGRIKQLAYAQSARSVIMLTIGLALAWAFDFFGWAIGRVLTEAGALGFAIIVVLRGSRPCGSQPAESQPRAAVPQFGASLLKPFLAYGSFIALSQTLDAVLTSADVISLDHFHNNSAEIAQYGIAVLIFSTALLLPYAFLQSHFARLVAHAHDPQKTWENFMHYTMVMLLLAGPAAAIGYFAAPKIVSIFGPGYQQSGIIFQWLIPAYLIKSMGTVAFDLVAASGRVKSHFAASLTTAILNIALNIALVPRLGIQGAVAATTASYGFRAFLSMLILWQYQRAKL